MNLENAERVKKLLKNIEQYNLAVNNKICSVTVQQVGNENLLRASIIDIDDTMAKEIKDIFEKKVKQLVSELETL